MKIALCLEYPLGLRGGVSVLVENMIHELIRRGHAVVLVSPDTPDTLRNSSAGGLVREHVHWNTPKPSRADAKDLARRLAATHPDLAHFHSGGTFGWGNRLPFSSPVYYVSRLGIPTLFTVHLVVNVLDGFCGPQKPLWFKLLLLPLAWWGKTQQLRHTRFEIAVSQHDLKKLRRWYAPFRSRFVQIYHSRLREGDRPVESAERDAIVLNVGHLAWRKGQAVLAEAFARVAMRYPEWTLQLAGENLGGDTLAEIQQIARQHRLENRILLLGERNDALDLMRRAAIYVQPSFWEALGLALQEAMSCGCPVVGSRAGGIPELIDDGRNGFLVEPGNVAQLSAALEELMSDPTRREQFGRAAVAAIREKGMTVEAMVQRHLELYDLATKRA